MRDSSAPTEMSRAEDAKSDCVETLKRLRLEYAGFHFNWDMNDEKSLWAPGVDAARKAVSALIKWYSAYDKYGRIGIVSSVDTLEKATKRRDLPSSPQNYVLAKQIGTFLKGNEDQIGTHILGELDKRHAEQRYGVLAMSSASLELLGLKGILGTGKEFDSIDDFVASDQGGWVKVIDKSVEIGRPESPQLRFSVFLYR
jgi:hypothetical protein